MTDLYSQLSAALAASYRLERELGRGGMATVYLAHDLRHDRSVALKVMHPDVAHTVGPERFRREIKLAARLQHPHILTVHDSGEAAGQLWYTMPYVEGESLRDWLRRDPQLSVDDALRITCEVADALGYAHSQDIVHRDIKPENVLLAHGHALVADFGVARAVHSAAGQQLTETGMSLGTPAYMSPEQGMADPALDGRSDLYSLGCVLYEMLAGEPPYTGRSGHAIVAKRLMDPVPSARRLRETVPLAMDRVLQRVLAKVPADRYPTAAAFVEALKASASDVATGPEVPAPPPPRRPSRKLKATVIAGAVLLIGALVMVAAVGLDRLRPSTAPVGLLRSTDSGPPRLAVLPFENRGTPEQDYFADGMTDEVRGKLSGLPALKVISRTSSAEYKKTPKRPVQIGEELGVQYLLTATVRWDKGANGDRVRVSPELIDARDASTKWQAPFDAAMTDVFAVQGQIAGQVAQALNVVLGATEQQALAAKPTQNLAAYDAFLKGESISASLTRLEPITLRRALEYYKQAVTLDSTFVQAWLQVTRSHSISYALGYDPTPARKEATRRAAERVTALRPGGYESHWARAAYAADVLRDMKQGGAETAEALRLFPTQPELLRYAANYESLFGDNEAALAHLRQAALLDPRSIGVAMTLVGTLGAMGRGQEALAESERAMAIDPVNLDARGQAVMLRLNAGDLVGAQQVVREAPAQLDTTFAVWLASAGLSWVMDDTRQRLVLGLSPAAFDNDRTTWGGALAMIYRLRGDSLRSRAYADSSRVEQARLVAGDPDNADQRQHLAMQLALSGRKAEATVEAERARALASQFQDSLYIHVRLADIYLVIGETDKALAQLEMTVPRGYPTREWVRIDPAYARLKGNPRFERLAGGK